MVDILGNVIIGIGIVFILFGEFGLFRYPKFYSRALICSIIDTCAFITILIGVIIKQGFSYFSFKVLIILIIMMIINPISTHSVTHSAYFSGFRLEKEESN